MSYEIVIGLKAEDIDEVADLLRLRTGTHFEKRDSLYRGEYNLFRAQDGLVVTDPTDK